MKKLIFRGPVLTASGYGVHARQLLNALISSGKYDIYVISSTWGQTPMISDDHEFINIVQELIKKQEILGHGHSADYYDLSVQVTIPNEFQRLARINIGVTAGIEVDRVSPEWIIKANENVDLVIVPSRHSAHTFANVRYRLQDGKELFLTKPLVIVPEGVDILTFNKQASEKRLLISQFAKTLDLLDTSTNFLHVGLGLDHNVGEDRKNISTLVSVFCKRFAGDKNVGLILKTSLVGYSMVDFEACKSRIEMIKRSTGCGEYPKIHLLHGRLTDPELAALYSHEKVKALVTLTHGEGFGLPLLEAAACGLPVIATNWSGHLDFLSIGDKKKFIPVNFEMKSIPQSCVWKGVMEEGTNWACVNDDDAGMKMKKVLLSYEKPKMWASELADHVQKNYSVRKTNSMFVETIDDFLSKIVVTDHTGTPDTKSSSQFIDRVRLALDLNSCKSLLYTMPMSAGDVYISTAVVDSLKKKFPEHRIFFATDPKYASILDGNADIHRIIRFEDWMANVPLCESIFDEVYTPNLAIQTNHSNWVHGGKGRKLGEEIAAQCQVEFGEYNIKFIDIDQKLPDKYIVLHPGSGKGQWEARNYTQWQDVVSNLTKISGLPIVQVGLTDDPQYEGCIDLRGKTSYNQLASVISKAVCVVGIDSVTAHLAAGLRIKQVTLYGSSYSHSTGPVQKSDVPCVQLSPTQRLTCKKACYKYQCSVDKNNPCINLVQARDVVFFALDLIDGSGDRARNEFVEFVPKIAGYTHILNPDLQGLPFVQSIKSMLGFCDEVVVIDGGSTDGSIKKIETEINDSRVKIFRRDWDWEEPGMDGMQKAYGRAMCSVGSNDFLWQQDADEVVHEEDYVKIKALAKKFPRDVDLIHLPIVEFWGSKSNVRTDRHSWKWRMSRNDFRITHGINKSAKVIDEKSGKTYAKQGMSDGCEYIDIMTGEFIMHKGFYNQDLESLRVRDPQEYGRRMNKIFGELPCVFHYSWVDLERKIRSFKSFWNGQWSRLYNDQKPIDRFPDVNVSDENSVTTRALQLEKQGGEHERAETFKLERSNPELMRDRVL